jgi:hypothetical protein
MTNQAGINRVSISPLYGMVWVFGGYRTIGLPVLHSSRGPRPIMHSRKWSPHGVVGRCQQRALRSAWEGTSILVRRIIGSLTVCMPLLLRRGWFCKIKFRGGSFDFVRVSQRNARFVSRKVRKSTLDIGLLLRPSKCWEPFGRALPHPMPVCSIGAPHFPPSAQISPKAECSALRVEQPSHNRSSGFL